jgi:hypothetical protein
MFRLLCIAMVLASVAVIVWLIVELRADKRDQERYEATDLHGRLPLRDDL